MIRENKQQNNIAKSEEWKAFVDSTATLEDKFQFHVFAACLWICFSSNFAILFRSLLSFH